MGTSPPTWRWHMAAPAALALGAVALVIVATRDGLGTTPDGVSYLGAAHNLAAGRGLTGPFTTMVDPFTPAQALAFEGRVPFVQWPPLYPLLLGVATWAGVGAETAARYLSAGALAATVAGTAWVTARLASPDGEPRSGRTIVVVAVAALAAGAWVLASPYVALLHVLVASEHLFVAFTVAALWAGSRWLAGVDGRAWPWAATAIVAASAATLTRYAGIAVVLALAVAVIVRGSGDRRRRVGTAAVVAAVGAGPALLWSQLTSRQAGVPTRSVVWHPPDGAQWEGVGDTVVGWFAASGAPTALRAALVAGALGVVALAAIGWRSALAGADPALGAPRVARTWLVVVASFIVAYLAVVVGTHSLLDRAVPISQRLLVPLQPPVAATVAAGVVWWWRTARATAGDRTSAGEGGATAPSTRWVAIGVLAWLAVCLVGLRASWWPLVEPGRPWAPDPATSEVAVRLQDLPPGAVVAANDPALAWDSTGRTAIALPVRISGPTGQANDRFDADLDELGRGLAATDGVAVVYGTSAVLNPHVATVDDLTDAGFEVVATPEGATVLTPPAQPG